MKSKTIKQLVVFDASGDALFDMLMDEKKHSAFTGDPAKITRRKGGKFIAGGNYISGKNLELLKGKKIVQEWHASDMPDGLITIVTYEFKPQKDGTTLMKFTHSGIPENMFENYDKGWVEYYWEPMKKYIAAQKTKAKKKKK